MTQYAVKLLVSAALIVAVTELSKRSTLIGGVLASLPLVSFLAMLWLYFDTHDAKRVAVLSMSIFWLVLPSLAFFLALPALLNRNLNFYLGFGLATAFMLLCYGVMLFGLRKAGVSL